MLRHAGSLPPSGGSPRRVTHEILDEIGAVGWPKTSGGSGLHVYVRIQPRWSFGDVRRAALAFAREVERRAPDDATTTWWRKDRAPDKVFVDYNQNARDHTIASAYSLRGVPEATVSTPITWAEGRGRDSPPTSTSSPCPVVLPLWGDLHEGIDEAVFLHPSRCWSRSARDEAAEPPIGEGLSGAKSTEGSLMTGWF